MKKRGILLLIFGLIFLGVFLSFVSAESILDKVLNTTNTELFSKFLEGTSFAKFLLFLLVALIIYGLGDFLPFTSQKPLVNSAIAVIVAYLSTMFLDSQEIYSILLSYSALGIVITGMVPFFMIAVIQFKAYERGYHYASKLLWIVYIFAIAIKWSSADLADLGFFGSWAYPLLAIAAICLFIWESPLFKLLYKDRFREGVERYAQKRRASTAVIDADSKAVLESEFGGSSLHR